MAKTTEQWENSTERVARLEREAFERKAFLRSLDFRRLSVRPRPQVNDRGTVVYFGRDYRATVLKVGRTRVTVAFRTRGGTNYQRTVPVSNGLRPAPDTSFFVPALPPGLAFVP